MFAGRGDLPVIQLGQVLQGLRILDCTRNIAGPVATMLAAEMGAIVVKVEPPGGDEMRRWPPFTDGESVYFASCNRGKRSIVLDLKAPADLDVFDRLLAQANVFVENYRPGTLEKLGRGWPEVHARHPKLVWVSVSGYGRSGPRAKAPAYDSMIQSFTGMMGITGESGRPPVRAGGSPIDLASPYLAWGAILTGVLAAQRSGEGSILEVSLMESALGIMHAYLQGELAGSPMGVRMGSETAGIYPLGAFLTSNGEYLLLQVSNNHQWERLCALLGTPALERDERFADNPQRVRNRDALRPVIAAQLARRTAQEWERVLTEAGVPASHVRGLADVAADPQVRARNMVKPVQLASGREVPTWGVPVKMNETLDAPLLAVPGVDQHRNEILAELGRVEGSKR